MAILISLIFTIVGSASSVFASQGPASGTYVAGTADSCNLDVKVASDSSRVYVSISQFQWTDACPRRSQVTKWVWDGSGYFHNSSEMSEWIIPIARNRFQHVMLKGSERTVVEYLLWWQPGPQYKTRSPANRISTN